MIVTSGRLILPTTNPGRPSINESVAFSPDGETLAVGRMDSSDPQKGTQFPASAVVFLCGTKDGIPRARIALPNSGGCSVAYSPDGRILAIGLAKEVKLYDPTSARERATLRATGRGNFESVAFSPDGRRLATASFDSVVVWDLATNRPAVGFSAGTGFVHCVSVAPDGKTLASALEGPGQDLSRRHFSAFSTVVGRVKLWNLEGKAEGLSFDSREPAYAVCFSPDGRTLALAGSEGARLWDLAADVRKIITTSAAYCVAYSRDGRFLALGTEELTYDGAPGEVRLWDNKAGRDIAVFTRGMTHVRSVAFAPDGRALAAAAREGVFLWDLGVLSKNAGRDNGSSLMGTGKNTNRSIDSSDDFLWLAFIVLSFLTVSPLFLVSLGLLSVAYIAKEECLSLIRVWVARDDMVLLEARIFIFPWIYRLSVENQSAIVREGWAIVSGRFATFSTRRAVRTTLEKSPGATRVEFIPYKVKYFLM